MAVKKRNVWVVMGIADKSKFKSRGFYNPLSFIPTIELTPSAGVGENNPEDPAPTLSAIIPTLDFTPSDPTGTGSGSPSDPGITPDVADLIPTATLYVPILYETYTTGYDSDTTIYGDNWEAQIFQPQTNHNVTHFWLYLRRSTAGVGAVNISLYSTTGTPKVPNAQLQTVQYNANSWLNTTYQWKMIVITSQAVVSGTDYAIVVEVPDGDGTNYVSWGYDGSSPSYSNGYRAYSDDDASSWNQDTDADFLFEEGG